MWRNFWLQFTAGSTHSQLSRGGCSAGLRAQQLSTVLTSHHLIDTIVRIISLCYFRWVFSMTAVKSLTMKTRAAVCDPLCCTWQPNSESGRAKKCCWVVGCGFGVTAYLRDLLWCHLWGFKEESPDFLIPDIVRAKLDTLEIFTSINVWMRMKVNKVAVNQTKCEN